MDGNRQDRDSRGGFTLVEVMAAMVVMSFVLLGAARSLQMAAKAGVESRTQIKAGRLLQAVKARLEAMNFDHVGDPRTVHGGLFCDSSLSDYGLPPSYPRRPLEELQAQVRAAGFTHFQIDVFHARRDSAPDWSVHRVTGYVDLAMEPATIPTCTEPSGRPGWRDQGDPQIVAVDDNLDGDYADLWQAPVTCLPLSGVPEAPRTNAKRLEVRIYKGSELMLSEAAIVLTRQKLTGEESGTVESPLKLMMDLPAAGTYLADARGGNGASFGLTLALEASFPALPPRLAVDDAARPLAFTGRTEGLAAVELYYNRVPDGSPNSSDFAGPDGAFTLTAPVLTQLMLNDADLEGWMGYGATIRGMARKEGVRSPITTLSYFLDRRPPVIEAVHPAPDDVVATLRPMIRWTAADRAGTGEPADAAGLEPAVLWGAWQAGGPSPVAFQLRREQDEPGAWQDSLSTTVVRGLDAAGGKNLPPRFADGDEVTVTAEAADRAGLKVRRTWTFTVDIDPMDATPPTALFSPVPGVAVWTLEDLESGVDPESIRVEVDGALVLDGAVNPVGNFYDPSTGVLTVPASGGTVRLRVRNHATAPVEHDSGPVAMP